MKTRVPSWVALALSVSLLVLGACKRPTSSVLPVANPSATPSPAAEIAERAPVDLSFGENVSTVAVQRRWLGGETLHSHFGRGWGDDNVVRLTQIDRDAVLIWRGGRGWRVAHRDGEKFKTLGGGEITKNAKAWTYRSAGKESAQLEFDPEGRLKMERTPDGLTRSYGYDALGRLASISAKPNESIEYKYDANDRVSSVEGPNGKHATYSYKNDRLAETTNSASEKRAYSYDVGSGTLVVAIQGVARGVQTVAVTAGSAGAVATVGIAALVVADVLAIAEVGYKAKTGVEAWNAVSEERQAEAFAKSIRNALENKLRETLRNDPGRILPLASGRKPDPNKPADVEQLFNRLHANESNNRKPFEGVLGIPPDPEQEQILAAALKKARELVTEGRKLEQAAWNEAHNEQSPIITYFQLAQKLGATTMGLEVSQGALARFNQVVEDLRTHTAGIQGAAVRLKAAELAMERAAEHCETAATTTCDAAKHSGQTNDAAAEAAKAESGFIISQATAMEQASAQETKEAREVDDTRLREVLAAFLTRAAGYRAALSDVKLAEATATIDGMKTAIAKIGEAPAHLEAVRVQLTRISVQVSSILAPVSQNPEAILLSGQAGALGETLVPPSQSESERQRAAEIPGILRAALAKAEAYLPTLRQIGEAVKKADVETLGAAAAGALDQFKKNSASARSLAAQSQANAALKRATDCLARIKGGGDQVASASPGPQKDDEVTVPDLSVFETREEMKVVLKNAGLVATFVGTQKKTTSPEMEFKVAGQDPVPNAKAKRGDVVKIAIFAKYNGPGEQTASPSPSSPTPSGNDEEVIVPDLSNYTTSEMEAVLTHAGMLKRKLVAAKDKTPSKEEEFKFASQSPTPGTKVKRGDVVSVSMYPKFEDSNTADGTVPDVIGLEIRAAQAKIEAAGLKLVGVESGTLKPPTPDQAYRIYAQTPKAGEPAPSNKFVSVKEYGSGKASEPEPAPSVSGSGGGDFTGQWTGASGIFTIQRTASGYAVEGTDGRERVTFPRTRVEGNRLICETESPLLRGGAKLPIVYRFQRQGDDLLLEASVAGTWNQTMVLKRKR
jgi:YD repeat-containing protein